MMSRVIKIFKKRSEKSVARYDAVFILAVVLLALFGTVMVGSAGYAYAAFRYNDGAYFIKKQIIWLFIGIAVMLLAARTSAAVYKRITPYFYAVTLFLLALTLAIGFVGNGAQRWIAIGPLTIQPSESKIWRFLQKAGANRLFSERSYRFL